MSDTVGSFVYLSGIGFSLNDNLPQEIAYLSLSTVKLEVTESLGISRAIVDAKDRKKRKKERRKLDKKARKKHQEREKRAKGKRGSSRADGYESPDTSSESALCGGMRCEFCQFNFLHLKLFNAKVEVRKILGDKMHR